ncbi:MAG: enoyl-CoA hydratase/isomerase family protein [Phycisphaerales bacterium]
MPELATLSVDGSTATLTLNRAEKRNALSREMLGALMARLDELKQMDAVSSCIVTGAGASFCAGMDLKAVLRDREGVRQLLAMIAEFTIGLRGLPMPTIAKVNGAAIGGGCGIVGVCDIAVTHRRRSWATRRLIWACARRWWRWLVAKVGAGRAAGAAGGRDDERHARRLEIGLVSEGGGEGKRWMEGWRRSRKFAKAGLHAVRDEEVAECVGWGGDARGGAEGATLSAEVVKAAMRRGAVGAVVWVRFHGLRLGEAVEAGVTTLRSFLLRVIVR